MLLAHGFQGAGDPGQAGGEAAASSPGFQAGARERAGDPRQEVTRLEPQAAQVFRGGLALLRPRWPTEPPERAGVVATLAGDLAGQWDIRYLKAQ